MDHKYEQLISDENEELVEVQEMEETEDREVESESFSEEQSDIERADEHSHEEGDEESSFEDEETDTEPIASEDLDPDEASEFFRNWKEKFKEHQQIQEEEIKQAEDQTETEETPVSKRSFFPFGRNKAGEKSKKTEARIPKDALLKSIPLYLAGLLIMLSSAYLISPFGKLKDIQVKGNEHISEELVKEYSNIHEKDYVLSVLLNRKSYANNIVNRSNLIKDVSVQFQLPNRFLLELEEYKELGFIAENNQFYSILSSGEVSEVPTEEENMPLNATMVHITDRELLKKMALQLAEIDENIRANILTIDLTPTKATKDLLTLTMADGNVVLVPVSELDIKLPYYPKIARQLILPSMIDMEVGVYSYAL
ncbi:TPA: cell division protein FtsQ/DivIB [Streptococcus suis]